MLVTRGCEQDERIKEIAKGMDGEIGGEVGGGGKAPNKTLGFITIVGRVFGWDKAE